MHYISNIEELRRELQVRLSHQGEIRSAINTWIKRQYGIADFSDYAQSFFHLEPGRSYLALCRQIPSVRVEDIACHIASKLWDMPLLPIPFIDDSFSVDNHEKRSYMRLLWTDIGRNRVPYTNGEKIFSGLINEHQRKILRSIMTKDGKNLPDYHFDLRASVFGPETLYDASDLHRSYLRNAERKPGEVVGFDEHDRAERQSLELIELSGNRFRPCAEWYYPLYFSWFLDGSMVLLETYENELAQVSEAKKLFTRTMQLIEHEVGLKPLVLQIPPLDEAMLCMPRPILRNPEKALLDISQSISGKMAVDSVEFLSLIAALVVQWRG